MTAFICTVTLAVTVVLGMPGVAVTLIGITGRTLGRRGVVLNPTTTGVTHAFATLVTQGITVLSAAINTAT